MHQGRDDRLQIVIACPDDREYLVAELWDHGEMWGEINQDSGEFSIEIYPRSNGQAFKLSEAIEVLQEAKLKLVGRE